VLELLAVAVVGTRALIAVGAAAAVRAFGQAGGFLHGITEELMGMGYKMVLDCRAKKSE
jgi:hypothetical protein